MFLLVTCASKLEFCLLHLFSGEVFMKLLAIVLASPSGFISCIKSIIDTFNWLTSYLSTKPSRETSPPSIRNNCKILVMTCLANIIMQIFMCCR